MKDRLNKNNYPYMTTKVNLIKDLMSSCQINFNENLVICKDCDVFEYCKVKYRLRGIENAK